MADMPTGMAMALPMRTESGRMVRMVAGYIGCAVSALLAGGPVLAAGLAGDGATAFPGARGYGAGATGWRGGEIIAVTSLADAGPGSLRACAEAQDRPRVCVITISGTVDLAGPIMVRSNVYIAGQTAPGDGLQLRIVDGKHGPLIVKNATDVVIRHLKLRPGASPTPSTNVDAMTIENSQRVYLGNLSMAFATDETVNIHVSGGTAADITIADSIIALSLDRANHPKGRHSKGALICSSEKDGNACGRISLIGNLFAHHRDRMPDIKGTDIGPIEVINNVFYNPISQFGEFYDLLGDALIVYQGNVALTGPNTIAKAPEAVQVFEWTDGQSVTLVAQDNLAGVAEGCTRRRVNVLDATAKRQLAGPGDPLPQLTLTPLAVDDVFTQVLARAGDRIPGRRAADALDARVLDNVRACSGRVINAPDEVGGWPVPAGGDPALIHDGDGDGLPDAWEATRDILDADRADDPWRADPVTRLSLFEAWLADSADDLG